MTNKAKDSLMYRNFDLATLEREYSPSSCVEDITVYLEQYIKQSHSALSYAKQHNSVHCDLSYGQTPDERLDLFMPFEHVKSQQKLHVYIHGGYWQELTKDESCFAANNFQQHGYHFAALNYGLAPKVTLTEIVEQCRRALLWLYQNAECYGYHREQIYLSGSSAGGHLVMMMVLTDWMRYADIEQSFIKGICAVSGVYDLSPIAQTYINEPLQLTAQEIENNSPLLMTLEQSLLAHCQITLAYGANETTEFKRQSLALIEQLSAIGVTTPCNEIADRNHFDVILDLANEHSWLCQQAFDQMR